MKQEPEAIKKFRELTQGTMQNLKTELVHVCLKSEYKSCAAYLSECIESLQNFIETIIREVGSEQLSNVDKLTTMDSVVQALKGQNKELQQKLLQAHQLIQEKQTKITSLETTNTTLNLTIVQLQNFIADHNEQGDSSEEDSLENLDMEEVEEYVSECGSGEDLSEVEDRGQQL